eukprot:766804-Hanusia_phi.AAC.1
MEESGRRGEADSGGQGQGRFKKMLFIFWKLEGSSASKAPGDISGSGLGGGGKNLRLRLKRCEGGYLKIHQWVGDIKKLKSEGKKGDVRVGVLQGKHGVVDNVSLREGRVDTQRWVRVDMAHITDR